jgi:hypothetical protein
MLFAVYTDKEGYIGDVSAPSREVAAEFLASQGYAPGTFELRDLVEVIEEMEKEIHPEG